MDWTLTSPINLVVNGSFQADGTNAIGWTASNATVAISGSACQVTATADGGGISQTTSNLEASHEYTVVVSVNGGGNKARVYTTGADRNMDVTLVTGAATVISEVIKTDASGTDVIINLTVVTSGQTVTFDQVAFYSGSRRFAWSGNDLDMWRHSSDYTKIDGADIYPDSIPASSIDHAVLSAVHNDTTTATVARGDIITGQGASPTWSRLAISVPGGAALMNVLGAVQGDTEPGYKAIFDANNPATLSATATAAPGTSLLASHRDHVHAITTTSVGAASTILATDVNSYTRLAGLGIGTACGATNQITMVDGATIGQAAGPLLTFDDTNNYLEITGCNVGIGTTAPGAKLDVAGDIALGTSSFLYGRKTDSSLIRIAGIGGDNITYLGGVDSGVTEVRFRTGAVDRVTIDNAGNVGIGTTAPARNLHVSSGGDARIAIDGATANLASLDFRKAGVDEWAFYMPASSDELRIIEQGVADGRLTIKAGGNVGIGTTGPTAKLDIQGSDAPLLARIQSSATTYGPELRLVNTATGGRDWRIGSGQNNNSAGQGKFFIYDATAALDRLVIDSSGNVGIGTTSPGYALQVGASSGSGDVWIGNNCSALSFTDRTPYPDEETALAAVLSMKRKDKAMELDHDNLHPFVSKEGERNLSATVSAHNVVIQQLLRRVSRLEQSTRI